MPVRRSVSIAMLFGYGVAVPDSQRVLHNAVLRRMVKVTIVQVVDVAIVSNRDVPTVRTVHVPRFRMCS
jgi:hypothetical protein